MNIIFKILEDQHILHDREDSGYYSSYVGDEIFEDERGKYKVRHVTREVSCGCHPETCSHFDGTVLQSREHKEYLPTLYKSE